MDQKPIIIIMGVSGTGKSTVGELLSNQTGIPFFDADDYHPTANKNKMANGLPLNDNDREGWLDELNDLAQHEQQNDGAIIACSALKSKYRDQISKRIENIKFVHLVGSFDLIMDRIKARKGHFMPPALLQSQFDTLEVPEEAIEVSVVMEPKEIVLEILTQAGL